MRKRLLCFPLCLMIVLSFLMQCSAVAQDANRKTVRVGWYESTYNITDESGRRSGYAYEYQMKLSSYNGWEYEYVKGSWSELLEMLEQGEIDLMSDVSYTKEREKTMLYSSLPMGTEEYYVFTAPGNDEISPTDRTTLNGKRVGANRNSLQASLYADWAKQNAVESELVQVSCSESESLQMLERGELDAYVTVDSFMDPTRAVPMYKIGSSDYYFAVSKSRPDLLEDLNFAMSRIQDENRFYNQQMYEKYMRKAGANAYLSSRETDWLSAHGTIRVGYQDNYLAFCATDKETGELTGVLKDYLALASDSIPGTHIEFQATAYPTAEAAMSALQKGEVDCVFPANLSAYDAELYDTVMTPPLMDTEMYAVVRMSDPRIYAKEEPVVAAVNEGNPNYDAFLGEHFPSWGKEYYKNTESCLRAVSSGAADCVLISNFRYNNLARLCEQFHLTTFTTGVQMDYCFAVERGETELYSILAKVTGMVPHSTVNAMLSYYITEDAKLTLSDFIVDNLPVVMTVTGAVVLVILVLLMMNVRAVKVANSLISATETDDLTGLYNRKYFFQYANQKYREHPDSPKDAIVLNIEQFHSINALHGRELGDLILRTLGSELRSIAQENDGIAGRFEADRFDLYCRQGVDYQSMFDHLQAKLEETAPNANVRLRMGVMPWEARLEPVQLFDRARTACNMARGHYKAPLIVYDRQVSEREVYEQRLVNDFRSALEEGQFQVYYQPKYEIQTERPRLSSAEALVRWQHPELGMVSPGDFIPLFERNGQISELDRFVWEQAAAQIALWREKYCMTLPVSVNLSRVDVFDPDLTETLDAIVMRHALARQDFLLEVTESAYTENAEQLIQVIHQLRDRGYKIEMDDFGSGYSSLNMLSSIPVDVLKMDMGFVRNIERNEKDLRLVELIIDISDYLKVPVIAEGVETESQLRLLITAKCELVQGYYFSRPLPAEEFEGILLRELKQV